VTCTSCGAENVAGQKFCGDCGARLTAACPACGASNPPGRRFCGECGTSLTGVASDGSAGASLVAPAALPPATAERRLVSVLFADLVGFTSLAEGRDTEDTRELLSRYFDAARDVVERYGGTVEKFIGDAVMAVWGAPTAHEDDAERAVRAALDLIDAVPGLSVAPQPSGIVEGDEPGAVILQARAGVLTGEAAVTLGAEGQGMVAGDLVNTASRLQSVAPPGAVLVGQATRDAASVAISFEPVGDQMLRGKSLPIPAWRAVRVIARVGGAGRYEGLEPPFEGRDEELRLIKDLFHATARERRARLVTLIGQAGTGKSRLIRELEKYVDGHVADTYWHVGRSPSYGEGITFWALGEMVRKRAGLAETDDATTTRNRIAATLEEFVPDEGDRRWIEPRLLQLLGVEEGRVGEREELFAAWRTFFERVAERGPSVMVFEDLEFADAGLLEFIDHNIEWSRGHPNLILATARPELLERRPGWGAGHRNFVAIGLEPLTDDAMQLLLAGLVPGLPERAIRAILSRAEGVPLYAVETVRMLLNTARLTVVDGVYRPVGDLTELEVPNTLHALIAARLDALDPADRSVLQYAAVLGQTFVLGAVSAVSGEPPDVLEQRLRSLVRREVLVLDVDPRSPERGQYGFVQGLVREVAYATLSKRDRRSRHLAAARYLESLDDEEIAGALAMHYLDAWRASPDGREGDALAGQARIALRAAAERAASLYSPSQALAFIEHALTVTPDELERAELMERAGSAAEASANFQAAERYWTSAIETYQAHLDRTGEARAVAALGLELALAGENDRALEMLTATYEKLGMLEDDAGVTALTASLARAHALSRTGSGLAIELADRAIVAAERLNLVDVIADAIITKGVSVGQAHRVREALILLSGVLALAEARGFVVVDLRARINISQFSMSDDPRLGFEAARVGVERAQKYGIRVRETLMAGNAFFAALFTGDWDWVLATAQSVLREEPLRTGNLEVIAYPLVMRAFRGDSAEIEERLREIRRVVRETTDPQFQQALVMLEALFALAGDDPAAALSAVPADLYDPTYGSFAYALSGHAALWLGDVDRAKDASNSLAAMRMHGRVVDASRQTIEAGIAALEGRTAEAVSLYAEAARQLRDLGLPLLVALGDLDLLATLGPGAARVAAEQEARDIVAKLGATALLPRLDALAAVPSASGVRSSAMAPTGLSTELPAVR